MPIYEYRCNACGFQKEFLQRLNDAPHTKCPECGKRTFKKLVTAAGFQLKGTGWYATDFKNSGKQPSAKKDGDGAKESSGKDAGAAGSAAKESSKESSKSEKSEKSDKSGAGKSSSTTPAGG